MKFFATIALLLVIVSVSLGADDKEVRTKESKGHEKESRSALYNGGLSNAHHQDKHREWYYGIYDNNYIVSLIQVLLNRIQQVIDQIEKQLEASSNNQENSNATTTESENETTEILSSTEPISIVDENTDDDVSTFGTDDETTTQDSSFSSINPESRARLVHGHGKSKKAEKSHSKSIKSHSSKAKSHGSKNHDKGHSKSRKEENSGHKFNNNK